MAKLKQQKIQFPYADLKRKAKEIKRLAKLSKRKFDLLTKELDAKASRKEKQQHQKELKRIIIELHETVEYSGKSDSMNPDEDMGEFFFATKFLWTPFTPKHRQTLVDTKKQKLQVVQYREYSAPSASTQNVSSSEQNRPENATCNQNPEPEDTRAEGESPASPIPAPAPTPTETAGQPSTNEDDPVVSVDAIVSVDP